MFFAKDRILNVRKMFLARSQKERMDAIEQLFAPQKNDFSEIFEIMEDKPTRIRLMDFPRHEILPKSPEEKHTLANAIGVSDEQLERIMDSCHELNPMLGLRGARLGIVCPEVYEMQVRAILESACDVYEKT